MDFSCSTTLLCLTFFLFFLSETTRETESSEVISSDLLHHKECGEPIGEYNVKFKEMMDKAFVELESGILKSDGHYYEASYRLVKVMARCEGGSGNCECGECVSDAVRIAKEDCGGSISAEIYFGKCFISYVYRSGFDGFPHGSPGGASRNNNNTEKLAAIVVGGAAALLLGFVFFSLLNSRLKKDDYE